MFEDINVSGKIINALKGELTMSFPNVIGPCGLTSQLYPHTFYSDSAADFSTFLGQALEFAAVLWYTYHERTVGIHKGAHQYENNRAAA